MLTLPDSQPFAKRLAEIDKAMAEPDFFADNRQAATLSREHGRLSRLLAMLEEAAGLRRQLVEVDELLADPAAEAEMRELAREEKPVIESRVEELDRDLVKVLVPPSEDDDRNTIVEIRAGAGGDEASLFAADLHRMYCRFADANGWRVEPMSASFSESGGFKEVIFSVTGEEVYRRLKFESGVHRVQRVPVTESGGRIHTSTATVAVLPEAQEVDVQISPDELEITVSRASGPGGQGVNTTDSAVQIIHKPTGITVNCADERSQLKNKLKAMTVLRSRLLQARQEEERRKYADHRRSQIGTGDRSERIRTYNFPQSRLTDHRINLTVHNLEEVLEGIMDELIDALIEEDSRLRLAGYLASFKDNGA